MLFFREYGNSGQRVVLLHGGPGAPGHMASVARGLADSYRVLEPFQRGSGRERLTVATHVEDLYEVVSSCTEDCAPALLGSSWGAMLALAYAAAHPISTGPLILVGCGTFDPVARSTMQETIERRMNDEIRERLQRASQIVSDNARLKATADAIMPIYSYELVGTLEGETFDARAHHESWDDMVGLQATGVYPAAFASIKVPVLMVHGTFDPHPGRLIRASLQPYLSQLEYKELEACGHYPWLEKAVATRFFWMIREWLARHTEASRRAD
jgi:pimeloyl-ACP methyl ester carboxylesterase